MNIHKTYKFKLKPSDEHSEMIDRWIGVCRCIYNLSLEVKKYCWYSSNTSVSYFDFTKQLTDLRSEYDWVRSCPRECQENALKRLDFAYKAFFRGEGYPSWAIKDKYNSITFRQSLNITDSHITIPILGQVPYFNSRNVQGKIKTLTIVKEFDGYYASILTEQNPKRLPVSDNTISIDMGVIYFGVTSAGEYIENPRHFQQYQHQLRVAQRSLSRKVKGSNNREKQKRRVIKLHNKIKRSREDFLHKLSTRLISENQAIIVEKLNVKGLLGANRGLSRSLSDVSIGKFFTMLEYKAQWYGRDFVQVDPKYTSQDCSQCGHRDKRNRKSQSEFKCLKCGHEDNADHNASINILSRGTAYLTKRKALA